MVFNINVVPAEAGEVNAADLDEDFYPTDEEESSNSDDP